MKKAVLLVLVTLMFTSCLSTMFAPAEYVPAMDSLEVIEKTISNYESSGEYLKKFRSKDKMGNRHEWIIYDDKYFSVDGIVYAYKFHELMTYSLVLTSMKGQTVIDGSEDVIGFHGYASPVNNPETIVSFIIASELFAQKGYSSMHEASQIRGVSFIGLPSDEGYIDDFGRWKSYTWTDYFEKVFSTRNKDAKKIMYSAMSLK